MTRSALCVMPSAVERLALSARSSTLTTAVPKRSCTPLDTANPWKTFCTDGRSVWKRLSDRHGCCAAAATANGLSPVYDHKRRGPACTLTRSNALCAPLRYSRARVAAGWITSACPRGSGSCRRSKTVTLWPCCRNAAAVQRPIGPAPMTATLRRDVAGVVAITGR